MAAPFAEVAQRRAVRLLDADPGLVDGLGVAADPALHRAAATAVLELAPGPVVPLLAPLPAGSFGYVILDGMLSVGMHLGERLTLELLGPTDLIRPGAGRSLAGEQPPNVDFRALTPASVAVLDVGFARRVAAWPEIASAVIARSVLRARRLQFQAAVRAMPRIEDRLLLMLWHYAERWGRVTRDGVVLDLRLTHEQIAAIVGAQRPTVTVQLGGLEREGVVRREQRVRWTLCGEPPPALWALYDQAGLAAAAPAA